MIPLASYLWNSETVLAKFGTNSNDGIQNEERSPKQDEQHEDNAQDFSGLWREAGMREKGRKAGRERRLCK